MIVGVTGGIGSGKSMVIGFFSELGVPVYYADYWAKQLMETDVDTIKEVKELLGEGAYQNEKLNRSLIAEKVFNDKEKLVALNAIVHPKVHSHFKEWAASQEFVYVIQESALIFENKAEKKYDTVILITAPQELRIARVMERDSCTKQQVLDRMQHQLSDEVKSEKADLVIVNIDKERTRVKVQEVHQKLVQIATTIS